MTLAWPEIDDPSPVIRPLTTVYSVVLVQPCAHPGGFAVRVVWEGRSLRHCGDMEVFVESTHFVVVAGPMSSALSRTVQDGFDCVRVSAVRSHTVIECRVPDQSALRALLTQLWDAGTEILLVSQILTESPRSDHGHAQHRNHPTGR